MNRIAMLMAAIAMLVAVPAQAKIVEQNEMGFVVREKAVVGAKPRDVWMTLISPAKWWNERHTWSGKAENMTLTPQAGGCFCEHIPGKDAPGAVGRVGSVQHMVVVQAFPDRVLRMRGGLGPLQSEPAEGVLTITLKQVDAGTLVVFEYAVGGAMRFETKKIAGAVDQVISAQLGNLATLLGRVDKVEVMDEHQPKEEGGQPIVAPKKAPLKKEPADSEKVKVSVEDVFGSLE